jgi:threonine dehydrogenase-like Zn-dependent dehydrogenase
VKLEPLVTEVVPLREWRRAFEASRAADGIKYVLDPR